MSRSFAVAICAPSGVGKTTVARALLASRDDLRFSVSVTTRPPRPGEQPGVDYHFVGRDEFEAAIRADKLLEWAEVHGHRYGTPLANLEEAEREGAILLLDIDVQGARQVAERRPDSVGIFLLPPSFEALRERMRGRGSEDRERLRRRMETALNELACMEEFAYIVVNDELEDAVAAIDAILTAEGRRRGRDWERYAALRERLREGLQRELR